jgi:hypothetical protein
MAKNLIRHSMCQECWKKAHPAKSAAGHQAPTRFRTTEQCCFCLATHKSGIYVPKNRDDRSVKCACTTPYAQPVRQG